MLPVDEHQFQQGYTPIACGLMFTVISCVLGSIVATIWWLLFRGR